ncbi:hypothetical protein ATANTOWER_003116 [Ataeniobius toweri]|uniref:Interleukin-4 n=1 Tax=Ataeniobius toweri TaxID=208326 RepID=A0ABU7AP01_9TELE|nr:hypothetical protein [Ataeniobius toweri]
MRTFTIRCSALMTVMMVAVLCSASVHNCTNRTLCDQLLKNIGAEAVYLTNLHLHEQVKRVSNGACQRDFFCLAEKALGNITYDVHLRRVRNTMPVKIHEQLETLKRLLHQYNKQTKINCHLNTNVTISLTKFFKRVETCADLANNHTK